MNGLHVSNNTCACTPQVHVNVCMYLADFHKVIKNAPNYAQWSEYIKTQALKTVRKRTTKAHTHTHATSQLKDILLK